MFTFIFMVGIKGVLDLPAGIPPPVKKSGPPPPVKLDDIFFLGTFFFQIGYLKKKNKRQRSQLSMQLLVQKANDFEKKFCVTK